MKILDNTLTHLDAADVDEAGKLKNEACLEGVEAIANLAASTCSKLTEIRLPTSVSTIGYAAFSDTDIRKISLHDGIKVIRSEAFRFCINLMSFIFPEGIEVVEDSLFLNCVSLETLVFSQSITVIGQRACCNCSALTTLRLPKYLITIKEQAFFGCSHLITAILPETLTTIENGIFDDCYRLKYIVIDTDDEAAFARIKALLPEYLQHKCMTRALYDTIHACQIAALDAFNRASWMQSNLAFFVRSDLPVCTDRTTFGLNLFDDDVKRQAQVVQLAILDVVLPQSLSERDVSDYTARLEEIVSAPTASLM